MNAQFLSNNEQNSNYFENNYQVEDCQFKIKNMNFNQNQNIKHNYANWGYQNFMESRENFNRDQMNNNDFSDIVRNNQDRSLSVTFDQLRNILINLILCILKFDK